MINRKLQEFIQNFYKTSPKALLLTGARQTGKTYALRAYGKTYKTYLEINFVERPEAIEMVKGAKNVEDLLLRISALASTPLSRGETFIFFDEVQLCPEIVSHMKFLVDDGRFRYAMSGSLLGVELKDLKSEPVGYIDIKEVFPLSIVEFFTALGVSEEIIKTVRLCWEEKRPVDEFIHNQLLNLFRLYLLVGGMPAVVDAYLRTNDLNVVREEQLSILRLYRRDIAQYDPKNKLYLDEILELIPSELNAKNKRFILKNLNENAKYSKFANDFLWLKNAGVAIPVYNVEEPVAPLLLSKSRNLFKLFQNDVGLLAAQYSQGLQLQILNNNKSINFGGIYENVVAQELLYLGYRLFYFNSKKQGEVDFLVEDDGNVLPIEVKSGKDYLRHNALTNLLSNPDYDIDRAIVFNNRNLRIAEKVIYAPIYMAAFIKPQEISGIVYSPDLTGLQ